LIRTQEESHHAALEAVVEVSQLHILPSQHFKQKVKAYYRGQMKVEVETIHLIGTVLNQEVPPRVNR
jgi:hypothetical protein